MKKVIILLAIMSLFIGCATLQNACEHGDAIKARIRAALQVAQVGYPLVMQLAGSTTNPDVQYKISLIDAALDLLGQLAYDILCPDLVELDQAESALNQAQEAKTALGIGIE